MKEFKIVVGDTTSDFDKNINADSKAGWEVSRIQPRVNNDWKYTIMVERPIVTEKVEI